MTRPIAEMSDEELRAELDRAGEEFDALFDEMDDGHAGSPGEWLYERIDEIETAMKRRGIAT